MAARQKKATVTKDSLASFTQSMSQQIVSGGFGGGYRDGPFSGYAKDATGLAQSYYSTSWIARQAVEAIPEDCFKKGYQWVAEAGQINLLEATEKRHKIQQKKRQALSWSRLDGEAFIYFDVGDDPSRELVADRVGRDRLRFVNVLRKRNVNKGQIISDPLSEFYGKPEYYEVTGQSGSVRIHPSRIVHFISSPDPETGEGQSVLMHLLPPIVAAETARDNVVALVTESLINVIGVEGLMDNVQDPATEALIVQRYALMSNLKATNKTLIHDKDKETFDRKSTQFGTLPDVIEAMRREAAAAIGRPYSLMFGRASGLGTNGDSEVREYYDTISTMQRNDIQPECEMLDEVVIRSSLGNRPPEIYIEWSSLWETSDQEKANISKAYAEAAKTAVDAGIMVPNMLTTSLMNAWVEIGAFPGIEQDVEEHIAEIEELESDGVDVSRPINSAMLGDAAPRTLYVSRKVVNASEIIGWAKSQGFKETLRPEDLHVTIAYSRDPVDWMKVGEAWQSKVEIAEGGPRITETFGEAKVLLFKSSDLEWRHQSIREAGASWDHPEYQPHITISYADMPEDVAPYQGKIILGPEIFEEVNDDWRGGLNE